MKRPARRGLRRTRATAAGSRGQYLKLPPWMWLGFLLLAAAGASSANPLLTVFAILSLPVLAWLLWFSGEPPALLFACGYQWLQASIAIFFADVYQVPLSELGGEKIVWASWLSLFGVLVLAIGMRLALMRRRPCPTDVLWQESLDLKVESLFVVYLVALVGFSALSSIAYKIPALTQPLLAATTVRWALVFLLAHSAFSSRRGYVWVAIMLCIEFFTGILGYFSGFKNVFFVVLLALLSARRRFTPARMVMAGLIVMLLLFLGAVWTVVKGDYREFLNQGTGTQSVLVPVPERVKKLTELVGNLDGSAMEEGLNRMIIRVSYVNFFSLCILNVPENVPHTRGRLWLEAVQHVLMPRFLFADKPTIDDSERTRKYTGINVAGAEQGTSIGIGYIAESYVDFGAKWMFAPILLLGIFYGLIYRYFAARRVRIFGLALATSILVFGASAVETSNIKLVGGNLMAFLVLALFAGVFGDWFWRQISAPSASGLNPRTSHPRSRRNRSSR